MHDNCNNNSKTFLNTIPSSFIDCETQRTTVALHTLYTYLSTAGLFVTACVYLYVCCLLSLNEKYSHPPFAFYLCSLLDCLEVSLCLWPGGGGGGYLTKFYTERLRPEDQPLTLSYSILAEKGALLYTFY